MISFQPITLIERIKRIYPPYRDRRDAEAKATIRHLIEHPGESCIIGNTVINNGYGTRESLFKSLTGVDL